MVSAGPTVDCAGRPCLDFVWLLELSILIHGSDAVGENVESKVARGHGGGVDVEWSVKAIVKFCDGVGFEAGAARSLRAIHASHRRALKKCFT